MSPAHDKPTVLITGASSGIGKATAKFFQQQGWNVVATMRSPDKEQELNVLDNVHVTRLDVQDAASIASAVGEGIDTFGKVDVLVNNAGYGSYGVLEATPIESIRRQLDVNVIGLLETTKGLLPHFRARSSGVVVNISSMGGKVAFPLGTLYHASKFAVEGLSEALSFELEAIGVRVKLVKTGMVKTDFAGRSFDFNNDESLAEYQPLVGQLMAAMEPMAAAGSEPSQIAEVIYKAATDGTAQMRYPAGPDAVEILAARKAADDESFRAGFKSQFGL